MSLSLLYEDSAEAIRRTEKEQGHKTGTLKLEYLKLVKVPPQLQSFTHLKTLSLAHNKLEAFPQGVG
jgi:hypothetical protein